MDRFPTYRKLEMGLDRNHTCIGVEPIDCVIYMVRWYNILTDGYSWYLGAESPYREHARLIEADACKFVLYRKLVGHVPI
jgi:hypothetical protein